MRTTETRTYPIGKLCVVAEDGYIVSIHLADDDCICDDELVHDALNQLEEYFGGQRKAFSFKMKYSSCTAFQADVWDALQTIPYGKTEVSKMLDQAEEVLNWFDGMTKTIPTWYIHDMVTDQNDRTDRNSSHQTVNDNIK